MLVKRALAGAQVSGATIVPISFASALLEGERFAGTAVVGAYLDRTLLVKSVAQIGASWAQSHNHSVAKLLAGEVHA